MLLNQPLKGWGCSLSNCKWTKTIGEGTPLQPQSVFGAARVQHCTCHCKRNTVVQFVCNHALCLHYCCTTSFVSVGKAALVLHECCTDEETSDTVQRIHDVINESNASVLLSWTSAASAGESNKLNEVPSKTPLSRTAGVVAVQVYGGARNLLWCSRNVEGNWCCVMSRLDATSYETALLRGAATGVMVT